MPPRWVGGDGSDACAGYHFAALRASSFPIFWSSASGLIFPYASPDATIATGGTYAAGFFSIRMAYRTQKRPCAFAQGRLLLPISNHVIGSNRAARRFFSGGEYTTGTAKIPVIALLCLLYFFSIGAWPRCGSRACAIKKISKNFFSFILNSGYFDFF